MKLDNGGGRLGGRVVLSEAGSNADGERMVGAEQLLADCEGTLIEGFGLGIFTLGGVKVGLVVEVGSHFVMVGTEGLFVNRKRSLVERLSLGVFALGAIKSR